MTKIKIYRICLSSYQGEEAEAEVEVEAGQNE